MKKLEVDSSGIQNWIFGLEGTLIDHIDLNFGPLMDTFRSIFQSYILSNISLSTKLMSKETLKLL